MTYTPPTRILRKAEVQLRTGVTEMTLWRWERRGLFPKRIKLNPEAGKGGSVGWIESEVEAWLEKHAAARDTPKSAA